MLGRPHCWSHGQLAPFHARWSIYQQYLTPTDCVVEGRPLTLNLWDTDGGGHYDRLRPLAYPQTDAFLLCYSINSRSSFQSTQTKWFPELRQYCPGTPILLVATKGDLRSEGKNQDQVTYDEGLKMARDNGMLQTYYPIAANTVCTWHLHFRIIYSFACCHLFSTGAVGCYEMSSLLHQGVNEVMDAVILAALNSHTHSRSTVGQISSRTWRFTKVNQNRQWLESHQEVNTWSCIVYGYLNPTPLS